MATVLKPATTPDEIAACVRQRFEIYTEEMNLYRDSADHAERSLSDPFDTWARFFCAEVDGVVVAGVRQHWGFDGMEKAGLADAFPADWHDIYDFRSFTDVPLSQMAVGTRPLPPSSTRTWRASWRCA